MCTGDKMSCLKKSKIGLFFYQIFLLVLFALTIFIATLPFSFWMVSSDDMKWFCAQSPDSMRAYFAGDDTITPPRPADNSWYVEHAINGRQFVADADATINERDAIMCSDQCPCDVDNWDKWIEADSDFSTTNLEKDDDGVDDWSECQDRLDAIAADPPRGATIIGTVQNYFDGILELFEEEYKCQGICESGRFYLFREVDEGPVENGGCLTTMKDKFSGRSMIAAIILLVTAAIDLFVWFCMWQFCCKK